MGRERWVPRVGRNDRWQKWAVKMGRERWYGKMGRNDGSRKTAGKPKPVMTGAGIGGQPGWKI